MDFLAPPLRVTLLGGERVDLAYPLAKSSVPGLNLLLWRRWARSLLKKNDTGLLAVESPQGVLFGLGAYRLFEDLMEGRTLELGPIMLADLVGSMQIADVLVEGAERVALRESCQAFRTLMPSDLQATSDASLFALLHRAGHRQEATRLCKRLAH